jgi:hypothetical protein
VSRRGANPLDGDVIDRQRCVTDVTNLDFVPGALSLYRRYELIAIIHAAQTDCVEAALLEFPNGDLNDWFTLGQGFGGHRGNKGTRTIVPDIPLIAPQRGLEKLEILQSYSEDLPRSSDH